MPTLSCPPRLPLEEGLEHLRSHCFGKAIVALRLAVQREPGRVAVVRALATAYLLDGDAKAARLILEEFTHNHPMSAQGWALAAQLEWKLGQRDEAIEQLHQGVRRLPQSQALRRQLALFLAADGRLRDAADHIPPADPNQVEPLTEYLAAAAGNGSLLALDFTGPGSRATLDHDWLDQIAQEPGVVDALMSAHVDPAELSPILSEMERKVSTLLQAQPNHADRQFLRARLQVALGDIPAALISLQLALEANPKLIAAHQLRADLHAQSGQTDAAIEILAQLLKQGLAWPDIHYQVAALEQQRGNGAEARAHLKSALRLNPRFEQAETLLKQVA